MRASLSVAMAAAAFLLSIVARSEPTYLPPVADERDFGKAESWRGFLAEAARPRLDAEVPGLVVQDRGRRA